ncbi:MAG: hypothetical protein ABIF18_03465, partial [archaeon]
MGNKKIDLEEMARDININIHEKGVVEGNISCKIISDKNERNSIIIMYDFLDKTCTDSVQYDEKDSKYREDSEY